MMSALIFEVWLCSHRADRSNGVKGASVVNWVAVERGPFDPSCQPEHAIHKIGTFCAASKAEALTQARDRKKAEKHKRRR